MGISSTHSQICSSVLSGVICTFSENILHASSSTVVNAMHLLLGIDLASNGDLYVADVNNHRVRKISSKDIITTYAGTGAAWYYSGDGGPPKSTTFQGPKKSL
jgi:hypothetical protein